MILWLGIVASQALVATALGAPATKGATLAGQGGSPAVPIRIGDSVVALNGPWKFSVGDSPVNPVSGGPLWADPAFDDSKWETVDLTSKDAVQNPITGISGYVPGWTARGHAGYWGYAWYRIRIRVEAGPSARLALAGPASVDDGYDLYDNGVLAGSFGELKRGSPGLYYSRPMMFALPQASGQSPGDSMRVIAFRMYMQPQTLVQASDVGGFESAPLLGEAAAVASLHQVQVYDLIRAYLWEPIEGIVFGLLGLLALSLALFDRSDRVYLWIGSLLLLISIDSFSGTLAVLTFSVSSVYDQVSHSFILFALQYAGWVMVWRSWFRLRRPAWIPWSLVPIALLLMVSEALSQNFFEFAGSGGYTAAAHGVSFGARLVLSAFLLYVVYRGISDQGADGWLVLPAVLLATIAEFQREFQVLGMRTSWFPFGVQITLAVASQLLLVVVLAVLLVRRLVFSIGRQRLMALDVKQAQEVQQVMLPEARTEISGLVVESEYRPAREVGGDFFQIIPHPSDGSLLIVAGDVAGKGLKAGMLVALLVGGIRSAVDWSYEPEVVLRALNRRLLGRGNALATCQVLRVTASGEATLVNAGHVPPYLNGSPLPIEGSLPLGILEQAGFSVAKFQLAEGDWLMLMSDGVAEARNAEGELFGFERVDAMLHTKVSARDVAAAAERFGQDDDISVIAVTRTAGGD